MANPASIRLGTTGKAQVKADFADIGSTGAASFKAIGDAGDAQARRWSKSYENAGRDVEAALERQRLAAAKISAIMPQTAVQMQVNAVAGSNTRFGGGYAASASDRQTSSEGTARQSAMFFAELAAEEERLTARTRALVSAIDPAFAAQERFNREIGEARTLVSAGTLSLDQYVTKLRLEQDALDAVVGTRGKANGANGQQRQSYMMLGQQIQDFSVQVSNGGSVATAFSQQIGQAAFAVQGMGGKLAGVGNFLTSGWGIAATIALTFLAPLVSKILESSDALDKELDKLKKSAEESAVAARAKDQFARSTAGVSEAIRDQAAALEKAAKAEGSAAEQANISAKLSREREIQIRNTTIALLEQAKAEARAANSTNFGAAGGAGAGMAQGIYASRVADYDAALTKAKADLATAQKNVQATRIDLATESAARAADPMAQIKKRYDDLASAARAAAREQVKAGKDVSTALTQQLAVIERNRAAAVKAEQDKQKALNQTAKIDKDTVTASQVAKILRAEIPGVRVTSTTRTAEHNREIGGAPNSNHVKGNAIDFVPAGGMGAITKEDVRRIFTARGIDVLELLGPGDKGHSDHFHVAWTKGKLALDDFNDAAKRNKDAQRDLEKANKVLNDDLDEVVKQFDPARAAADEYAASLKKIAALRGAGKITADQAGDYTFALLKEQQEKAATQRAASFKTIFGEIEDPFAAGDASWRVQQDEQISAWDVENERRQRVQQEGVRTVAGLYRNLMSGGTRSIFDSFKEMGINAIAQLAAKWTMSQIGKLSGSGGLIGSLASLISGKPKVGANAAGTEYWGGGISLVGENGPEIVSMPRGSRVTPAADTRRMLSAGNENGRRLQVSVSPSPYFDVRVQEVAAPMSESAAMRGAYGGSEMAGRNLSLSQSRALV